MGWSIGYDNNWKRDIGYGVPAICDFPGCNEKIDRGLSYVCGGEPYGGEHGCGLFFCSNHLYYRTWRDGGTTPCCPRCNKYKNPYKPKPDCEEWIKWKLKDKSWKQWREKNPEEVKKLKEQIKQIKCQINL